VSAIIRKKVALVSRVYEEMRELHNVQQSKATAAAVLRQRFPEMSREQAEAFVQQWWEGDL
jgi:hypothetical protein